MLEFDKAVSEAHLKASGWDMGAFGHSNPFECHFVYVHDVDAKDVRLFSIHQSHLEAVPVPTDIPNSVLAYLVAESLSDIRKDILEPGRNNAFLPKLVAYTKCTKAYALWVREGKQRLHFIINVYRSKQGVEKTMLRPFVADSEDVVLNATDMMRYSKQVIDMDSARHPGWFV